jgi:hypothetical protein
MTNTVSAVYSPVFVPVSPPSHPVSPRLSTQNINGDSGWSRRPRGRGSIISGVGMIVIFAFTVGFQGIEAP